MSSEDWKTVLLALIATGGTVFTALVTVYLEILRRKSNAAEVAATAAKKEASQTKVLINGRMDEMLRSVAEKAYAEGKASGIATVSKAVAESPNIPIGTRELATAVATATEPPPKT